MRRSKTRKPARAKARDRTPAKARIFASIRSVPYGKVSTYGAIGRAAGLGRGARQVASALRGAFGLPWHRIVGAGGQIKLRGAAAFEQRMRLESEGVIFRGKRVNMSRHEYSFLGREPGVNVAASHNQEKKQQQQLTRIDTDFAD